MAAGNTPSTVCTTCGEVSRPVHHGCEHPRSDSDGAVLPLGPWDGICASFKSKREKKKSAATGMDMALLGNRGINWVVGIFTMTGE